MSVSSRHILHQGPVLGALARAAYAGLKSTMARSSASSSAHSLTKPQAPGPELRRHLAPLPADLVRDYVRHVGGDPKSYKGQVPAHLFPQWVFPLQSQGLADLPYPMHKVLNAGCRLELNAPLPLGKPLQLAVRLEEVDDNGRRVILRQRAVTRTADHPEALVAHVRVFVPLPKSNHPLPNPASPHPQPLSQFGRGEPNTSQQDPPAVTGLGGMGSESAAHSERRQTMARQPIQGLPVKKKKERVRVPVDAREIAFWRLSAHAGLDFAKLTGDFNPIHWVPPAAHAAGFRNVILHGFATLARAIEGMNRTLFAGDTNKLATIDVRFTRPLVLPARVGLYYVPSPPPPHPRSRRGELAGNSAVTGLGGMGSESAVHSERPARQPIQSQQAHEIYVGDAPGGPAYLAGTFTTR